MNYSPTASLGSEPLSLQTTPSSSRSATRQSSQQLQDLLDGGGDPFVSGSNRLSKSLYSSPVPREGRREGDRGTSLQSATIRDRFEKFFSLFSVKKSSGNRESEVEPFTEVSSSDVLVRPSFSGRSRSLEGAESRVGVSGVVEEVGIEVEEEMMLRNDETDGSDPQSSSSQERERETVDEESSVESTTTELPRNIAAESAVLAPHSPAALPASFPGGRGRRGVVSRQRASHSDSVTHTVHQVRERLRELAKSQNLAEEDPTPPGEKGDGGGCEGEGAGEKGDGGGCEGAGGMGDVGDQGGCEGLVTEGDQGGCEGAGDMGAEGGCEGVVSAGVPSSYPSQLPPGPLPAGPLPTGPLPTVDSSLTLVGSLSSSSLFSNHRLAADVTRSLDANQPGESPLPRSSSLGERRGSGLVMRKVSVCDWKSLANSTSFGTQTSIGDIDTNPSPVVLLDRLVTHGEMVHRGNPREIPLTELEGVDWFFYGGCPHGEELAQLQGQVALLHSQLLFERHQSLQHDRRSRRLLSQVRTAHRVREELERMVCVVCTVWCYVCVCHCSLCALISKDRAHLVCVVELSNPRAALLFQACSMIGLLCVLCVCVCCRGSSAGERRS